jgi:pimeloyl-ACP methyl ester carboxylesterase
MPNLRNFTAALLITGILFTAYSGCAKEGGTAQVDISKLAVKKVHVNDIDIAYRETGTGYPLILITGSSSTMETWSPQLIENFSRDYRVIIFDYRGIGLSTSSPGKFSIKLFTDDTAAFMDALKIEKANIFAWSMGTYVAQELAFHYPKKINRLILYAANVGGDKAVYNNDAIAKLVDTSGTDRERGERLLSLIFPGEWLKNNPDPTKYMQMPTEPILPESIEKQNSACAEWAGSYDYLDKITVPTLLVTGTEDLIAPPQNSIMMAGKIPASWLMQIKGGGHGLMYQYPDELSKIASLFYAMK